MKPQLALSLVLLATPMAMAQVIRPAEEEEIAAALQGCWTREKTFETMRYEQRGGVYGNTLCFGANNEVETISWDGSLKWGFDGVGSGGSGGTFGLTNGKLDLAGHGDGWFFDSAELSCDVLMRPGEAMRFENCVSSDGTSLPNVSFSRAAE